jgi:hypothetical protein
MVKRVGVVDGIPSNKTVRHPALSNKQLSINTTPLGNINKHKRWEEYDEIVASAQPVREETKKERIQRNKQTKKQDYVQQLSEQKQKHQKRVPIIEKNDDIEDEDNVQSNGSVNSKQKTDELEDDTEWTLVRNRSGRGAKYEANRLEKMQNGEKLVMEIGHTKRYMQSNLSGESDYHSASYRDWLRGKKRRALKNTTLEQFL